MKIKKYTVYSIQEGWRKIKEDLGEDAIILSVKEFSGMFEILATSPSAENVIKIKKEKEKFLKIQLFLDKLKGSQIDESIKNEIEDEIIQVYSVILDNLSNISLKDRIYSNPLEKNYILIFGNISSGKSTTIAKLASILKFERNKKICLASFDFYKIGGSESLFKFAEIMQIPYFLIKEEKDLILHKSYLDEFDHILFDTPGNIKYLDKIENLVSFVSKSSKTENILVIPLTKKELLIDKDLKYFSRFNIDHLILTKYDLIENKIPLYYVLTSCDYPISYITNGLNVPQDIFNAKKLLEEKVL